MNYAVHMTQRAQQDIEEAHAYIEHVLKNPQAAEILLDEIDAALSGLTNMPERHPPVRDELLAAWDIRFVQVRNYLAFFTVDHASARVELLRFLYGKSSWAAILQGV